jgi:hypothetical protein
VSGFGIRTPRDLRIRPSLSTGDKEDRRKHENVFS